MHAHVYANVNRFNLRVYKYNHNPPSEHHWLVVSNHLKNMLVKLGSSSPTRSENKKCLKPPPRSSIQHSSPDSLATQAPKPTNILELQFSIDIPRSERGMPGGGKPREK